MNHTQVSSCHNLAYSKSYIEGALTTNIKLWDFRFFLKVFIRYIGAPPPKKKKKEKKT